MKIIERNILPFQEKDYLAPLRSKVDFARLIVLASRILLLEFKTTGVKIDWKMKLIVDKMSRLFFYKNDRYFSVAFPFSVRTENNHVTEIFSYSGRLIDSKSISAVISVLQNEQFRFNPSCIDFYIEANSMESIGLLLLEEIFQFEPAYIRYDVDPTNQKGKLHPLYHIDINYSPYGTLKLGLNNKIKLNYFEDLLNINTDCAYILDP